MKRAVHPHGKLVAGWAFGFQSTTMIRRDAMIRSARRAALIAGVITIATVLSSSLRGLRERSSPVAAHVWLVVVELAGVLFAVLFAVFFALNLRSNLDEQQLDEILEQETPESELLKGPLHGFVAMELYWLFSNRTYVVFVAPEGLYGWKAAGPVTNSNRRYFEPLQQMMEDKEFMRDLPAIKKLAGLSGGFFIGKSELTSVSSDSRRQWGMGGIVHSGHIVLNLASGKSRKLILLGEIIPEEVRDRIVSAMGLG